jgi:hypothetical protein
LLACATAFAASPTTERVTTLAELFSGSEAAALSRTLPADRGVRFRVRLPAGESGAGILVYVSPSDSGELPEQWKSVLEEKRLTWIAADGYGNSRPTAERMLVAVMALKLARQLHATDEKRQYVAGVSGGGRVASRTITNFPQLFTGALFIVGADYFMPEDAGQRTLLASRRMVFVTGSRDFNHREMREVRNRYQQSGIAGILWIDDPGFGHELASTAQLLRAVGFLDAL